MKKEFATSFAFLTAFFTSAQGEGNFSAVHEEESDSFLLTSGNLGLLNNEFGRMKAEVKASNEAFEAQANKHTEAIAAKDETIATLNARIAELEENTPSGAASTVKATSDPKNSAAGTVNQESAHMKLAREAGLL